MGQSLGKRCVLAGVVALFLFLVYFYPFLPYPERERAQTAAGFVMVFILALLAGFTLTLGNSRGRYLVPACFMGAMFVGNVVLIGFDWLQDPTAHNLFPLEFLLLGTLSAPAFAGAAVAGAVDRARHEHEED